MKKFPYCAEEIQDAAIVCRYCGGDLQAPNKLAQQTGKAPAKKQPYLLVGAFLFIMFCCAVLRATPEGRTAPTATPKTFAEEANSSVVMVTFTPEPTKTAAPTRTPRPAATSTPIPEPIFLTSVGDSVLNIQKWEGPAILKIKYTGNGYFGVKNYAANSTDNYDLLVNTIGPYEGTVPLDFRDGENTGRFEITAALSGAWEFHIEPLTNARTERIPGTISGAGDDIVLIGGGTPDLLKADASQASGYFGIKSIANARFHLVINELAPYVGAKILDPSTIALIIHAAGPWSLEITTR